jgi:phosphoglycolate phosphatase (TIGR01487 family)
MRFKAVACDYDGTLASHDRLAPPTVLALERARAAGLRLLLVTGRSFFELTRVCHRLDLFHAVVAENGGVLYFPTEGRLCDMAVGPPRRLLRELDRREIPYQAGRVVIGTTRDYEERVAAALTATGVTLAAIPNRESLMLLPQGVDKGSSVRHVIRMLGLSPRDVLALGDAENDVALFEACGFAGCPGNAVDGLKGRADWVFSGDNGGAIAAALGQITDGRLLIPATSRHRIRLGWAASTAESVAIPARGANILVQGDPRSGKSWLAGALVERLVGERYATCVIDLHGDYHALAALPGVARFPVSRGADWNEVLAAMRHDPAATVVVDLSGPRPAGKAELAEVELVDKVALMDAGLRRLRALREERGFPHWIVLDEAHPALHPGRMSEETFGGAEKGFCLVTHRPSALGQRVVDSIDIFILARTTLPEELSFLRSHVTSAAMAVIPALRSREFVLAERGGPAATFVAPPRLTSYIQPRGPITSEPGSS